MPSPREVGEYIHRLLEMESALNEIHQERGTPCWSAVAGMWLEERDKAREQVRALSDKNEALLALLRKRRTRSRVRTRK